ncbi:MAG TPA: M56 family metallopeptidase [Flavitalea sp.]|nr:M56 family metallopeptidase [Flavitalea sp.]
MNLMYQSAFAKALGWSLMDSLWQMSAIWFLYIIISSNGTRYTAEKRHTLALLGTAAGTIIFFISLALNYYSAVTNNTFFSVTFFMQKQMGNLFSVSLLAENIVPLISFIYLPAVGFFSLRLLLKVSENKNVYAKSLVKADNTIATFVDEMTKSLGINKKISVWISGKAESALTIGYWKPVILLPVAVVSQLTCRQAEAVITHELYHIKRNDYLINLFLESARVILFFNPFARWMISIVNKEREHTCDDCVISTGFEAWEYSQALYLLGKYRNDMNRLALAATGTGKEYLLHRIRRIMKKDNPSPSVIKPLITFFLCLIVTGFAGWQKYVADSTGYVEKNDVNPVAYYSEGKEIIITAPIEKKAVPHGIKPLKKMKNLLRPDIAGKPVVALFKESPVQSLHDQLNIYTAAPHIIEFSMIDPGTPVISGVCEDGHPFVQKSSFYFKEIDSTAGKKIINL